MTDSCKHRIFQALGLDQVSRYQERVFEKAQDYHRNRKKRALTPNASKMTGPLALILSALAIAVTDLDALSGTGRRIALSCA